MAPLLLLPLPVLLLLAAADGFPATCSNVTCGNHTIEYPFWLNSSASSCGYPGLGLACESNATPILSVRSHRYRVIGINYITHTVSVSDADIDDGEYTTDCPRLYANLSIDYTSSWLQLTPLDSNITFLYNCKKNVPRSSAVELRGCQGYDNKSSYVLPDGGITGAEAYEYECEAVVVAPVMDFHKKAMVEGSFGGVVKAGFELIYNRHSQQCGRCEDSGGGCGYQRNETHGGMGFTCFCDGGPTTARCGGTYASSSPALRSFDSACFGFPNVRGYTVGSRV